MPTSWHGVARAIFYKAQQHGVLLEQLKLAAISSEQYPTPAKRPAFRYLIQKK